jgi:predicted small secreted protein
MLKRITLLLASIGFACGCLIAGGCNTIEGVGKDVKATGAGIEKAAEQSKPKSSY